MMLFESILATITLIISVVTLIAALLAWEAILKTDGEIREIIRESKKTGDGTDFWTE